MGEISASIEKVLIMFINVEAIWLLCIKGGFCNEVGTEWVYSGVVLSAQSGRVSPSCFLSALRFDRFESPKLWLSRTQ